MAERANQDTIVVALLEAKKRRYDSPPRLRDELEAEGMAMNCKTVAESMRRHGLGTRATELFRHATDSCHSLGVAPNLFAQDFSGNRPDEKWAGDITYPRTMQGWFYLAVTLDLCMREVVGWAASTRIDAELAYAALQTAIARRGEPSGMFMHTDRGSVYCGWDNRNLIRRYGLVASMSGRGNCCDNILAETINGLYKAELMYRRGLWESRQSLEVATLACIVWFNEPRLMEWLCHSPPADAEANCYRCTETLLPKAA